MVAPKKYKQLTKRFRKPLKELSEESGRGPVADQLRAILADEVQAKTPFDLFKSWDDGGGGSVSRKEFRNWWPKVGYEVPHTDLDELFDEFDVDGSGEIDYDEFKTMFDQKGQLWKELGELQKQHDESQAIHKAIVELEAKIGRKEKQRSIANAAKRRIEEKVALRLPVVSQLEDEIAGMLAKQAEHQARLDAFKGGAKNIMAANRAVNAFKSMLTPDEAAIAIQSKVRGRSAAKMVQEKKAARLAATAVPTTFNNFDQLNRMRAAAPQHAWQQNFGFMVPPQRVMPHPAQTFMHSQAASQLNQEVLLLKRELARQEEALRRSNASKFGLDLDPVLPF